MYNPMAGIMGRGPQPLLTERLLAYPAVFCGREDIERGDKILLPTSMLQKTFNIKINRGIMIFCVQNTDIGRQTYCGVLQFVADDGMVYLPGWMFNNLALYDGQKVNVTLINDIKIANFVKIQPHKTQFINLPNPRALLENELRNFTCLHEGDTIRITLPTRKSYDIDIITVKPENDYKAVCIINCNMEVDFEAPLDYVEPEKVQPARPAESKVKKSVFDSDKCSRYDGKDPTQARKMSEAMQEERAKEEEYDPRKHRLPKGVRTNAGPKRFEGAYKRM